MGITICPNCQRRIIYTPQTEDISHQCDSKSEVLDNEDISVVGEWTDFSGSGNELNINMRGIENTLFGQRAAIEGEQNEDVTSRGNRITTHRTRKHLQFIKIEDEKNGL